MKPASPPGADAEAPGADAAAAATASASTPRAATPRPWTARLSRFFGVEDADAQPASCEADPARLARMSAWLTVLLAGYCASHGAASRGLPSDGRRHFLAGDIGADVGRLLECGIVLGWLLRVDEAHRFRYLSRRCAWLLPLFFAVGPAWSAMNAIPALQVSLMDLGAWRAQTWAALGVGAVVVAALLCWQAVHAWRSLPPRACAAYAASRIAPFAFFGIAVGAAQRAFDDGHELREPHLHHYAIAMSLAAFGRFNRAPSAILLALAAGVFVQGIGAYGFAPLLEPAGCKNLTLPSGVGAGIAYSAGCRWNPSLVGDFVRLRVCPADAAALQQSLFMHCKAAGAHG